MRAGVGTGAHDVERAADKLAARIPQPLAAFARLAYNYRWSWHPGGEELFRAVDPHRWALCGQNPVRLLQEASTAGLSAAAADFSLRARASELEGTLQEELAAPPLEEVTEAHRPIAFLCAEYAIHPSLPIYSGGLGALAGDFLKEASDRRLPLVAIGLMYRQGYFRQRIDAAGVQHEYWVETDPRRVPAALVTGDDGAPLMVSMPIRAGEVTVQIWRVDVGRVPLFLLDAEVPQNNIIGHWNTARLYSSDASTRLAQYALLGVGGLRALAALGITPGIVHLNEGHAAFAFLESVQSELSGAQDLEEAWERARSRTVFTTHTPVAAGNDTYPAEAVIEALGECASGIGLDHEELIRLGRTHPDDSGEPFGVTQFALRTSRTANGVSARHAEVAREMWRGLWPERPVGAVPIGHVTNGVHLPTWIGEPMRRLLSRHLDGDWRDPVTWQAVDTIPDEELWAARSEQRASLIAFARDRSVEDRLGRDEQRDYVIAADNTFDPDHLTIGFARRLAPYKRLNLLLLDMGRALAALGGPSPIQLVLAGKAHPRDDEAKQLLRDLFNAKYADHVGQRVVYLADYDLAVAARFVQGCDVWLNLPRPPLEASGTSGMKAAVNGGLNLSVLDGWWAEGYNGVNGWAISGKVDDDHAAQDARDNAQLFDLLERSVVPEFYDRDADGLPRSWLTRVRASLRSIGPGFSASRMLADYEQRIYAKSP